jgi:hypothetical protein
VLSPKYFQICILERICQGLIAHHQHYQSKEANFVHVGLPASGGIQLLTAQYWQE